MKFTATLILFILFSTLSLSANAKTITCLLRGKVENRSSKALFLMKATANTQTEAKIRIPITGKTFQYALTVNEQEAYQLIFEDELEEMAYKPVIFFPDTSEIQFTLYSMGESEDKNEIKGGPLNQSYCQHMLEFSAAFKPGYMAVRQQRKAAISNKAYYTAAYDSLAHLIKTAGKERKDTLTLELNAMQENGTDLSPTGMAIKKEEQRIVDAMYDKRYEYVNQHATLVSFYMVYDDLSNHGNDQRIRSMSASAYAQLAKAMPSHPYTNKLGLLVSGKMLQKGKHFIDFQAPDLQGKTYQFSSLMQGKVILLDLWASWCGPCIAKTKEILPLYNDFKDKGFQVIGVAREFKDLENLKIALAREKHPWLTLVDLEDKQLIWNKYGLNNSGGGIVLFNHKGDILAINPTAGEIKKILKENLE